MQDDIIEWPITDELDLHCFNPKDLSSLLTEYLGECRLRGISPVRIVHGKGAGALREGVHAWLSQHADWIEQSQWPAAAQYGGWGATWVWLNPIQQTSDSNPIVIKL